MAAIFFRILALIALAMMPFGMTSAAAAAAGPHQAMTGMEAGHCDDMQDNDNNKGPPASHCALACSMVTAEPASFSEPLQILAAKPALPVMRRFIGRQPESDPPPPKLA